MQTPDVYSQGPHTVIEDEEDKERKYLVTCLDLTGLFMSVAGKCVASIKGILGITYQHSGDHLDDWVVVEVEPDERPFEPDERPDERPSAMGQIRQRST